MAPIRTRSNATPGPATKNSVSDLSSSPTSVKKPVIILKVNKKKTAPRTKRAQKKSLKLKLKSTSKPKSPSPERAQSVSSVASDISAVSGVDRDVYNDWMARNPVEIVVNMEETLANSALPYLMPSIEKTDDGLLPYVPGIVPRELVILPPEKTKEPGAKAFDEPSSSDTITVETSGKVLKRARRSGLEEERKQQPVDTGRAKQRRKRGKVLRRM